MFSEYRNRMNNLGGDINNYTRKNSQAILDDSFTKSTNYKRVIVNGKEYDARIISDSKTTIRSGAGNYVIYFKGGIKFKAGTYIDIPYSGNRMVRWMLIYEDDDPFLDKPIIKKCNYLLKWKNEFGEIIERDVVFNDNIRLNPNTVEVQRGKAALPMHSKIVVLPLDEETLNIQRDRRFLIDFDFALRHEPAAYVVVNRNITSKVSSQKDFDGVIELSLMEHQFNPKADNAELMIADYYSDDFKEKEEIPAPILPEKKAVIKSKGGTNLTMGMKEKEYVAEFYTDSQLDSNIIPIWEVTLNKEFESYFNYQIKDNKLYIQCKYSPLLINSNCKIVVHNEDNTYKTEVIVKVVSAI